MAIPVAKPKSLLGSKDYDGDRFRESLLIRGILPIIPPRSTARFPNIPTIAATRPVTCRPDTPKTARVGAGGRLRVCNPADAAPLHELKSAAAASVVRFSPTNR